MAGFRLSRYGCIYIGTCFYLAVKCLPYIDTSQSFLTMCWQFDVFQRKVNYLSKKYLVYVYDRINISQRKRSCLLILPYHSNCDLNCDVIGSSTVNNKLYRNNYFQFGYEKTYLNHDRIKQNASIPHVKQCFGIPVHPCGQVCLSCLIVNVLEFRSLSLSVHYMFSEMRPEFVQRRREANRVIRASRPHRYTPSIPLPLLLVLSLPRSSLMFNCPALVWEGGNQCTAVRDFQQRALETPNALEPGKTRVPAAQGSTGAERRTRPCSTDFTLNRPLTFFLEISNFDPTPSH